LSNGPVPRSDRFPGWDAERWGYHGDDGLKFGSSGSGTKYGENMVQKIHWDVALIVNGGCSLLRMADLSVIPIFIH
jgi:hypothetical protein